MAYHHPPQVSEESAQNRGAAPSEFWRRPVTVEIHDGYLVPHGMPPNIEPATHEASLDRQLAALTTSDESGIVAFASHFGLLRAAPATPLSDALEGQLPIVGMEWLNGMRDQLPELRRWIATGGSTALAGHLVPLAAMVNMVAELDDAMLVAASEWLAGALPPAERQAELLVALTSSLDRAIVSGATISRLAALPTQVGFRASDPQSARRLRSAAALIEQALDHVDLAQPAASLPPGWLRSIGGIFAGVPATPAWPLGAQESLADWRLAAGELALWSEAVRLLRAREPTWAKQTSRRVSVLRELRQRAGVSPSTPPEPATRSVVGSSFRAALIALLRRRLTQEAAWPRPGGGAPVPSLPRALWAVWPRIAGRWPARVCSWAGCDGPLALDAHGNRRYCAMHAESNHSARARERAARSYARRREASTPSTAVALDGGHG